MIPSPAASRSSSREQSALRRNPPTPADEIRNLVVEFFVEGQPVPKGRPRVTRSGHVYTPGRTVTWERTVARVARLAMRGPVVTDPVDVEMTFYGARANADIDNLMKAVLDAGNKTIWQDDRQVDQALGTRAPKSDRKGVQVRVTRI